MNEANFKDTKYLTIASVISAIAVVFLHTNGCFWAYSTDTYWFSANIIESLFYFAVPVFFMISGSTLIDYQDRYSTKQFFIKRFNKTVIPFIFWSLIGVIYNIVWHRVSISEVNFSYIVNGLLNSSIVSMYWFFLSLFCVYLCIPLLASVEKEKRKDTFIYLAVIGFTLNNLIPFIKNVFNLSFNWPLSVSVISGNLLFVVIGYLISHYETSKKWQIVIFSLSIVGLLIHIVGTYYASLNKGSIIQIYKGYTNVPCILYAAGIFLAIKKCGNQIGESKFGKQLLKLGPYTFSIYLIHPFLLDFTQIYIFSNIFGVSNTSLIYRLCGPLIIIPIAILIAWIIKKIPIVKRIVP